MVYSVEEIKNIVMPIVKRYNIPAIFLFGSYARGEANENSDIDFLVDTTGTGLNSLLTLGALYCDLEEAFEKIKDVNLIVNGDDPLCAYFGTKYNTVYFGVDEKSNLNTNAV